MAEAGVRSGAPARGLAASVVLVLLAAALAACAKVPDQTTVTMGGDDDGIHGAVLDRPYAVPPIRLHDTDGAAFDLTKDTTTPLTLVFFGYTQCPDVCQVVMATIASAVNRLDDAIRDQVSVVFVTTDPERDTPAVLRSYLDRFSPRFVGLTGDLDEIVELGEGVGVYIARGQELPDGGYEVDHSTPVIGVEPRGRAPIVWTQTVSAAQLAEDITTMVQNP